MGYSLGMRARLSDIAAQAEVSEATVSRVLNDKPGVSAETRQAVLTAPTDTGGGSFTHKFYKASKNAEELVGARDAIAEWARVTYGWIGRSPDYKAAFLATLGA